MLNDISAPPFINSKSGCSTNKKKINPIPINRRSLPNTPKLRIKLRGNAYKNFSKLAAAGSHTLQILNNIKKSANLKMIYKFEFDPYFCDSSCISELVIALKRLKTIKQFCLIIRRLDDSTKTNQMQCLVPVFAKLLRLKKLRVEFLRVENIKEDHILSICDALKKCYLLKTLEWTIVESPAISTKYFIAFLALMKKVRKLESYKECITVKNENEISNVDLSTQHGFSQPPKMLKMKNCEIIYGVAKEWSHVGENGDTGMELIKDCIHSHPNLENFKCRFIKNHIVSQDILCIFQGFASLHYLSHLEFELLNCQIGDTEFFAFLYCLSQLSQLKSLCFKVIQKSPLSMDYIEKAVDRLSAMENITNFDIYFRKQYLSPREISRLEKVFSQYNGVQCSFSSQSLYLYRNKSAVEL